MSEAPNRLMRAAIAVERGIVRCEEVEIPHAGPGEVLVRTRAASICGSDLHMVNTGWGMHAFPAMSGHPGHEAAGEVIESRSEHFAEGDIVLTIPHIWDARCFVDYQAVDDAHVLKLDPNVDIDTVTLAQQLGVVPIEDVSR
jgi:threonine dehydrogenase-like Zn-dependent dehydrogenase